MSRINYLFHLIADSFADKLAEDFYKVYSIRIETKYEDTNFVARCIDGANFTPDQQAFLKGFSHGYAMALGQVR